MGKQKKKIYKRWWFWLIIVLLVVGGFGVGGSDDTDTDDQEKATVEETTEATTEEATEPTTKSEADIVSEMGQEWFQKIDWDNVFQYKSDVHYIMGYSCQKVTSDELKEYGDYVATSSADLQNGFGAEFTSTIYIFMDKNGIAQHVFYDEADGSSTEIPMDSIPMLSY